MGAQAPGGQGAQAQEYSAYSELAQRTGGMHGRLKYEVIFARALNLKGDQANCKPDEGGLAAFILDVICGIRVNSEGCLSERFSFV